VPSAGRHGTVMVNATGGDKAIAALGDGNAAAIHALPTRVFKGGLPHQCTTASPEARVNANGYRTGCSTRRDAGGSLAARAAVIIRPARPLGLGQHSLADRYRALARARGFRQKIQRRLQ